MQKEFQLTFFDAEQAVAAPAAENTAEAPDAAQIEVGSQKDNAEVVYGKQPADGETQQEETSQEEAISYKQFKQRFKDEYQADLQRIIDKRFKNSKKVEAQRDSLLEQSEQYRSLLGVLSERYGTDDIHQLIGKISEDDSFLEQQAQAQGMKVDDYKKLYLAEQRARSLKEELDSVNEAVQQQALVQKWQSEAEELTKLYPEFDLAEEIENERFSTALQSGMEMRDAFQYAHFDEILSGVIHYTADNVKSALARSKAERMARPPENGMSSAAGAVVKSDVNKLSRKDMEEIDRRVLRGEKISF